MRLTASVALFAGCAALAACDRRPDTGAVVVSAIGGVPHVADASRVALDTPCPPADGLDRAGGWCGSMPRDRSSRGSPSAGS
ncbi:hypothetical protein NHF48_018775 [Sphingomonas sp. H160509]|uniref:hypothetical protein n=1 Tax=Sphingomonas sp. H160509 TaxID=2955313 RepID=UPI0020978C4F|nr:hypothetical protein [Sphingomonas sp. H160509]MDD1452508.1 hypothetical protein [Sphingomonas sp. H160509]